jgi:hypothetical protein
MARSKFTPYKYIKLKDDSLGVIAGLHFIRTQRSNPNRCIVGARKKNISKAPTTFTITRTGFLLAPTHWKHNAGGMPCSAAAECSHELDVLYGSADGEETSLLDFFVGSMAHDCEAYGCRYRDSSPPSSSDNDVVSTLALYWA